MLVHVRIAARADLCDPWMGGMLNPDGSGAFGKDRFCVNFVHGLASRGDRFVEGLFVEHLVPGLVGQTDDHFPCYPADAHLCGRDRCQGEHPG